MPTEHKPFLIRIKDNSEYEFRTHCRLLELQPIYQSTGMIGAHADTILFYIELTQHEKLSLTLAVPSISFMDGAARGQRFGNIHVD